MASSKLPHSRSLFQKIRRERGAIRRDFAELIVVAMLAFSIGLAVGAWLCKCR